MLLLLLLLMTNVAPPQPVLLLWLSAIRTCACSECMTQLATAAVAAEYAMQKVL